MASGDVRPGPGGVLRRAARHRPGAFDGPHPRHRRDRCGRHVRLRRSRALRPSDPGEEAADRPFGRLPSDQEARFRELWEEFEACETAEARFAARSDRLQPLLLNMANRGEPPGAERGSPRGWSAGGTRTSPTGPVCSGRSPARSLPRPSPRATCRSRTFGWAQRVASDLRLRTLRPAPSPPDRTLEGRLCHDHRGHQGRGVGELTPSATRPRWTCGGR